MKKFSLRVVLHILAVFAFSVHSALSFAQSNCASTPGPGSTLSWSLAASPHTICTDLLIPAGGTVVVDAGAVVDFLDGTMLTVDGALLVQGTIAAPVTINSGVSGGGTIFTNGTTDIRFATIDVNITGNKGLLADNIGSMLFADCTFSANSQISGDVFGTAHIARFINIERCDFNSSQVTIGSNSRVVASTFTNTPVTLGGYSYLDSLEFIGSGGLSLSRPRQGVQPVYLNNISVDGRSAGAGISLTGGNFFLDTNVALTNNLYPVELSGGGLLPGSTLQALGNLNNVIAASGTGPHPVTWPDLGLNYQVSSAAFGGPMHTLGPGVTLQFAADAFVLFQSFHMLKASGQFDRPIVFQAQDPAVGWGGIQFSGNHPPTKLEYVIIEDATIGVNSRSSVTHVVDSIIRNNLDGMKPNNGGTVVVSSTQILGNNNGIITTATGHIDAALPNAPNSFAGNVVAVQNNCCTQKLQSNWWGSPSGPSNVGGTGEVVNSAAADVQPFLTSAPSFIDHHPQVAIDALSFLANSGEKIILQWSAQDDGAIVAQRVEFKGPGQPLVVVAQLPGTDRAYEFTVPVLVPSSVNQSPYVQIVAVDNTGQENFDSVAIQIPFQEDWTRPKLVNITPSGGAFVAGDKQPVCWENNVSGGGNVMLFLDGDEAAMSLGGTTTTCLSLKWTADYVSTDTARIGVQYTFGAFFRHAWYFSDYFTIRPDSRVGDAAPTVQMLSPVLGESFTGSVPISWTAGDDEGLRSFNIQASYNGGRTWHVIARDLPGTARSHNWLLPSTSGIADTRLRVIAFDQRFQNTSDGADVSFAIGGGGGVQTAQISVAVTGNGSVTSTPGGINCPTACAQSFITSETVVLSATADAGWTFDHWSGDCTGSGLCSVNMNVGRSVSAVFLSNEISVTTLQVTEGWNSDRGQFLSSVGSLGTVQQSDNTRLQVKKNSFVSLQFAQGLSLGTIQSVKILVEHRESSGFRSGALLWEAGEGSLSSPTTLQFVTPDVLIGTGNEAVVAWDVSTAIDTVAKLNDLKFVVRNSSRKNASIDHVFIEVTHTSSPPAPTAPTITSAPLTDAVTGQAYSYQLTATGDTPINWALSSPPAGMTINASGLVQWTPATAGSFPVAVLASNTVGSDTQNFTVAVSDAPPPPADTVQIIKAAYRVRKGQLRVMVTSNSNGILTVSVTATGQVIGTFSGTRKTFTGLANPLNITVTTSGGASDSRDVKAK